MKMIKNITVKISLSMIVLSTLNNKSFAFDAGIKQRPMECTHPRWYDRWANGNIKPGVAWDMGSPSPALMKALNENTIPEGRALVPGCGRGYDVALLGSKTRYVLAIDIVEKAVNEANEYLKENNVNPAEGEVKVMDFFSLEPDEKFDFIYDYTFLCALDPTIRNLWAEQMAQLVKPGGELFCLIFPINEEKESGPPFKVNLELVKSLLDKEFECKQLEMLDKALCHKDRDGSNPALGASGIGRFIKK